MSLKAHRRFFRNFQIFRPPVVCTSVIKDRRALVYQAGGMDKPDSWRGGSADEVILDEYDDTHAEGQATAIEPMLDDFAGVLVRPGTPKGYGRLKAAYERAGSQPGWSRYLLRYHAARVRPIARKRRAVADPEPSGRHRPLSCRCKHRISFFSRII
jgi:hypothetical protein